MSRIVSLPIVVALLLVLVLRARSFADEPKEESPRITPLVKVIQRIEPSLVALFTPAKGQFVGGSGTIIHPSGYVLTNHHVLPSVTGYALLHKSRPIRFRVIGRLPEKDLAVVQLEHRGQLPVVSLGRSHDILLGEPIVIGGNPGGRGIVFTSGIISSRSFLAGGPNALAIANYENTRYDNFIQFDAASNRGNSGGPLVNMEGKLIGVVSALIEGEQNSNLAIPIDRVRELFHQIVPTELYRGLRTGVHLKPFAKAATIEAIDDNSAATEASLQVGDVIKSVNGTVVRHRPDWSLALFSHLNKKGPLKIKIVRGDEEREVTLTAHDWPLQAGVEREELKPGLSYKFYHGKYSLLPDFSKLTPVREETVDRVNLDKIRKDRKDEFTLTLDGLIKIPTDGIYRLIVVSDDGSRVKLHGRTIINNDGNHPKKEASRRVRLAAGLHPIEIQYFEGNGNELLHLAVEQPNGKIGEVPAEWFFH